MKITISISKSQWQQIGKQAGWITASKYDTTPFKKTCPECKGRKFVYQKLQNRGTADSNFFETLYKNWESVKEINIPQWSGIHDYITLWERK